MARTRLQRIFWRTSTAHSAPIEDFCTEVMAIAVESDPSPLHRMLAGKAAEDWPKGSVLVPGWLDGTGTVESVGTQQVLAKADRLPPGRLDLVIALSSRSGVRQELWVECKVDAGLTRCRDGRTQLECYLDHLQLRPDPAPVLVTLSRVRSLHPAIAGFTWADVVAAVDSARRPSPWWTDLVAFLRAERIDRTISEDGVNLLGYERGFDAINAVLAAESANAPQSLKWPALRGELEGGRREYTAGPLVWGLRDSGPHATWYLAFTNSGYPGIITDARQLREREAANPLPVGWMPLDASQGRQEFLFESTFPASPDQDPDTVSRWFREAFADLRDRELLDPHFSAARD